MSPALATAMKVTVKAIARHRPDCPYKKQGLTKAECPKCVCPKAVYVNQTGAPDRRISAKTTEWAVAQRHADKIERQLNPELAELDRLRAEEEAKHVRIEEAVALYIGDLIGGRKLAADTVGIARSMFGHVDPETKAVTKNGHLFDWLATMPTDTRPVFITDITPAHLTEWRSSWGFNDYTAAQRWGMVKSFFNFCETQGWISDSPARKLRPIKYDHAGRTAIFTDEQYTAILEAAKMDAPPNLPAATRAAWQQRLTTFVELLRWSGMSPIDAVQYRPEWVDDEGVLRYRRQKTGKVATVQLPEHVVLLLRSVPLEDASVGQGQPFRMKDFTPKSDRITWSKRLFRLFDLAGIRKVRNDVGRMRPPHPYMLRDTFAVWQLVNGVPLHDVAKALGHSNTTITEKHYLPWTKREHAAIANQRKALDAAKPKKTKGRKVVNIGNR